MDFVAIDFETANEQRCSPCAVAIVEITRGQMTAQHSWLIRPKDLSFSRYNTWIHGIRAEDVADKPEFDELWTALQPLLDGRTVLAHNASFDMSVLRATLAEYGIPFPEFTYSCTRVIAQKSWPGLISYGLKPIATMLGIEFDHHKVEDDAFACAKVAVNACAKAGADSIEALAAQLVIENGKLFPTDGYQPMYADTAFRSRRIDIEGLCPSGPCDPNHPFYSRMFAFTGTLESMTRHRAMEAVIDAGGQCGNGVTKHTNFLVLGDQDFRTFATGQTKSRKMMRAEELLAEGADLEIISELEFLRTLIGHDVPKPC
ncbi:MAG TPA: exonuclease domain-containing protein [Planctomycetaceae bacterium]|jgi:DNA polymerase-3 subunit epsilon|nr:exonuclease domain-containing protein [Planctomycetaceae bacterium]